MKYWVIIPAAGIGTRMKANVPKQYLRLAGQIILERVVNIFSSHTQIEKVVVVLHAKDHEWKNLKLSHPEKILTVIGGFERVHSVLLGLDFLTDFADKNDFVLVHDAARPCLKSDDISRLIGALKNHAVGGLFGLPIVDTLKKVNSEDCVENTVSREGVWHAQTPQCFRYALLKSSIEKTLSDNYVVTDESSAMEYVGFKPKIIMGNRCNIKITFPEDVAVAEQLLF